MGSHPQLDSKRQMSSFQKGHQDYYYEPPWYKLPERVTCPPQELGPLIRSNGL